MTPDDFAEVLVATIKRALLGPLCAGRIDALELRVAELEARLIALEARSAAVEEYAGTHGGRR